MKLVHKSRSRLVFEHAYSQRGTAIFTFVFSLVVLLLNNSVRIDAEPLLSIENFLFLSLFLVFSVWLASSRLSVCKFNKQEQEISVLRSCWFRKRLEIYDLSHFICADLTKEKSSVGAIYGISFVFSDGKKVDFVEKIFLTSIPRAECTFLVKEISDFLKAS